MNKLKVFIATSFGSGYLPFAPGTWGSATIIPIIWYASSQFGWLSLIPVVLICSALSIWVTEAAEMEWGKDPSKMVMDEWAGQALTFLFIPFSYHIEQDWLILLTGFGLFRFFDILKPLGISKIQSLEGGWGVLLDDLLAGLYALVILNILIFTAF